MSDYRLVLSNAPVDEAPALAKRLVEERLAACVNVLPAARSFYVWRGEICDDAESVMLIKTTAARAARLAERLVELHSYDVPEVIAIDLADGDARHLEWLASSVSSP